MDFLSKLAGKRETLTPPDVLSAYRTGPPSLDAAAILRLPPPLLSVFAVLGLLRPRRTVRARFWSSLAGLGSLPTCLPPEPWPPKAIETSWLVSYVEALSSRPMMSLEYFSGCLYGGGRMLVQTLLAGS